MLVLYLTCLTPEAKATAVEIQLPLTPLTGCWQERRDETRQVKMMDWDNWTRWAAMEWVDTSRGNKSWCRWQKGKTTSPTHPHNWGSLQRKGMHEMGHKDINRIKYAQGGSGNKRCPHAWWKDGDEVRKWRVIREEHPHTIGKFRAPPLK